MSPGEIRACYRLYAAHRKSHEICAVPETILAMNDPGGPGELTVLLGLHTGLEGLAGEVGHGDPNDDLDRPAVAGHVVHLRKMFASFAAQLFGRGALVGR
jgi:hypothetical protein